ncbi:hypothetical protein [Singulisphaera sp. PoT]|uniref:hypothetical protein n=1 Tax=Singulisphaera sp. PoT TaxID=3411797 RepID=UPI003BF54D11
MGRRLIFLVAMASAVVIWVRPARPQSNPALPPLPETVGSSEGDASVMLPPVEPAPAASPTQTTPTTKRAGTTAAISKTNPTASPPQVRQAKKVPPPVPKTVEEAKPEPTAGAPTPGGPIEEPAKLGEPAIPGDEKGMGLPPADLSAPPALPAPAAEDANAAPGDVANTPKLDEDVKPAQAPPANPAAPAAGAPVVPPPEGGNPLPPAKGSTAGAAPGSAAADAEHFVLPADRLLKGRQSVEVSVEVVGPETMNLHKEGKFKIIVKNTGNADAMGVIVRDELPPSLELLSSQPNQEPSSGSLLVWKLGTVPARSERLITLNVKAIQPGELNHAASITLLGGSKVHTIIREPRLKVEQRATTGKVVKGKPVDFIITVSNIGDGPARNVNIRATLSPGLKVMAEDGQDTNILEYVFKEDLPAGRTLELDPIEADTTMGGEQSCQVVADSPDVEPNADIAKSVKTVTVIEPKLKLRLAGDTKKFTDTLSSYQLSLENPGTATTKNVQVSVILNNNGKPQLPIPAGGKWDPSYRRISWNIAQIEPGESEKLTLPFNVMMGSPGTFQVTAEAKAQLNLYDKTNLTTTIDGIPLVDLQVDQGKTRLIDVKVPIYYRIRIRNTGTKEATNILVKAFPSANLRVLQTRGTEQQAQYSASEKVLIWPVIPRLEPGKEMTLGIQLEGIKPGQGSCKVHLTHDNDAENQVEDAAFTRITGTGTLQR